MQFGLYPYQAEQIPAGYCQEATAFTALVTGDIVDLRWTPPHASLYYALKIYRLPDSGPDVLVVNTNVAGSRWLGQLDPNADYRAELTTVCGTGPLRTSPTAVLVSFTTGTHVVQCLPVNIASVLATMLPESVVLVWPAASDAVGYRVSYKPDGSTLPAESLTVQAPQVTLERLVPNTRYRFTVHTLCSTGTVESEEGFFLTPCDPSVCAPPVIRTVVNGTTAVAVWEYTGEHQAYDVYLNSQLVAANYQANVFTFNGLAPNTSFTLAVVGRCADCSSVAGTAAFTSGDAPCVWVDTIEHDFDATDLTVSWPPVTGAQSYDVWINGSYQNTAGTSVSVPKQYNITYFVRVVTRCAGGGQSQAAESAFPSPILCPILQESQIVSTPGPTTIVLVWAALSGVGYYEWRYKKTADPDWSGWTQTPQTTIALDNLDIDTSYDFQVKTICSGSDIGTSDVISVSTGVAIPHGGGGLDITDLTGRQSTSVTVNFESDVRTFGTFVVVATPGSGPALEFPSNGGFANLTGLTLNENYEIKVEDREPGYVVLESDPVTFRTRPRPSIPTDFVAVLDGFNVNLSWNDPGVGAFRLERILVNSMARPIWQLVLEEHTDNTTDSLDSDAPAVYLYRLTAMSDDNELESLPAYATYAPVPTNLQSEVVGRSVNLSWRSWTGMQAFRVTLRNLQGTLIERIVNTTSVSIADLDPFTTYSWTVEAIATPQVISAPSTMAVFTTDDSDVAAPCEPASFTAVMQASSSTGGGTVVDNSAAGTVNYKTLNTDTFDRSLTFREADGTTPRDITGYTFELKFFNPANLLVWTIANGDGFFSNGGATGVLGVTIDSDDIMSHLGLGNGRYELRWTTPENVEKLIVQGSFNVVDSI